MPTPFKQALITRARGAALAGCLVLPSSSGILYRQAHLDCRHAVFVRFHPGPLPSPPRLCPLRRPRHPRRRGPRWHGLARHLQPPRAAPPRGQDQPGQRRTRRAAMLTRTPTCALRASTHTRLCTHAPVRTNAQTRAQTYVQARECSHLHASTCTYAHTHIHTYVDTFACTPICTHAHIYIQMHVSS